MKSDEKFRANGLNVPFDLPLASLQASGIIDTKPRGNAEPGNIQYTKTVSTSVTPLRYKITKTAPGKSPKGAGIPLLEAPKWPYQQRITIDNNTREPSAVIVNDILDNGTRLIGPFNVSGPDASQFTTPPNPIIDLPSPSGEDFVHIQWANITLSTGAVNTIVYDVAIWDNFTAGGSENSGPRIPHKTPQTDCAIISNLSGPVDSCATTLAMDLTIDKNSGITQVSYGTLITYTLNYKVNQYDNINGVVVTDVLSDGQTYQAGSANPPPTSVSPKNPVTGETTITWNLGNLASSTSGTITFVAQVDPVYFATGLPVVAGDTITNKASINGINANFGTPAPDSSAVSALVVTPSIKKELLNIYYKDGTVKPPGLNAAAPGDSLEFKLTYSSPNADQKNIFIDDFFPFNVLAGSIYNISYSPFPPATGPLPTGNNGLEWGLGNFFPAETTWTATFKVVVDNVNFVGAANNLAKLRGVNTAGEAYSDRHQVAVNFGRPDIRLSKSVSGPSPNAIQPGQTYTYTITIRNPQNSQGTVLDAFDFDLTEVIPNYLTFVPGSLTATATSGTPVFNPPVFTPPKNISMHIVHLHPNDVITVSYQVTVDAGIGPGLALTNNANTTSPYSQPFDPLGTNFQYPGLERQARVTIRSAAVTIAKSADSTSKVVGDTAQYTLTITVPDKLIAYSLVVSDVLPAGQVYDDNASPVDPVSVVGNTITWPILPTVDATGGPVTLVYSFRARITSSAYPPPTYTDVQRNTGRVNWNAVPGQFPNSRSAALDISVKNPHLLLAKAVRNITQGEVGYAVATNGKDSDIIEYRLIATNDGSAAAASINLVDAVGGLHPNLDFVPGSIVPEPGTTASYNDITNQVVWNIPSLGTGASATLYFRVRIKASTLAGSVIPDTGTIISYTNTNGAVTYPVVASNQVTVTLPPGVTLVPAPESYVSQTQALGQTTPGHSVAINHLLTNSGSGVDSYSLAIAPSSFAYQLLIDSILVTTVPAGTPYSAAPAQLAGLAVGEVRSITIRYYVPAGSSLLVYPTDVTVTSLTSPYPSKTVTDKVLVGKVGIFKMVAPTTAVVGEEVTYTLEVIVADGITAYQVIVSDSLPPGQAYADQATLDGIPVTPAVTGNLITFPTINKIDSSSGMVMLIYQFKALVSDAPTNPPEYLAQQIDATHLTWNIDEYGTPGQPSDSSATLTIAHPHLMLFKDERNLTQGQVDYSTEITAKVGEIIEYRLRITNVGKSPAYNSVITDTIVEPVHFVGNLQPEPGSTASYDSNTTTVTWTVPFLAVGATATLTFNVTGCGCIIKGNVGCDSFTATYQSFIENPKSYGPEVSNTVKVNFPVKFTFVPDPPIRVDDSTAAAIICNCEEVDLGYTLTNDGNTLDSYLLEITPLPLSYDLYIDSALITTVAAGSSYQDTPAALQSVQIGSWRKIVLRVALPENATPPVTSFNFEITVISLTTPVVRKTITTTVSFGRQLGISLKLQVTDFLIRSAGVRVALCNRPDDI